MSQSNAGPHPFLRRQKLPRAQDADMPEPAAAPPGLYTGERLTGAFERTASRLIEMRSAEYLALEHRG